MPSDLHFMMGEFKALFPTDRRYARNHMWARWIEPDEAALHDAAGASDSAGASHPTWRFGFSAYAVRLLQDVYFLDWTIELGSRLEERQEIGAIESSKAEASLYSPIAGELIELNETLLRDPSGVNVDKYGAGWLFTIRGPGADLLDPPAYLAHLEAVWQVTQRTIKGQMNE